MHPPSHRRHRSQRQRKKLRVAEFQELGFSIDAQFQASVTQDAREALLDRFVTDCIERHALAFGGGIESGFVCSFQPGRTVTEADRQRATDWLSRCPEVASAQAGPLEDCWYAGQAIFTPASPG